MKPKVIAIVPAAGIGKRFNAADKKTFVSFNDVPLLAHTLKSLDSEEDITEIIPVLAPEDIGRGFELVSKYDLGKIKRIAPGGPERQDSIYNALNLINTDADNNDIEGIVLIHDGARPVIPEGTVSGLLEGLKDVDGSAPGLPPKDTLKSVDPELIITATLDRDKIRAIQTPQAFRYKTLKGAYDRAYAEGVYATDDAALVERDGGKVRIIEGSPYNIKVTTPEDLEIVEYILNKKIKPVQEN